jgi:hypothetical protein
MPAVARPSETDPHTAERAELEAVLTSDFFTRAPRLAQILSYVCEKYFQGRIDQIKEYNIGVEALGRPPDFDQKEDAIVRVEAHRLRKRLQQYYEQAGSTHPLRIVIPPGQYVPVFEAGPAPRVRPGRRRFWLAATLLTATALAAGFGFAIRRHGQPAPEPPAAAFSAGEAIRILAGSSVDRYLDSQGNTWLGDRYFTGGAPVRSQPGHPIARTQDPSIFQNRREGDFQYDIPLRPGVYELRLLFAETTYGAGNLEGGGETSRLLNVTANGRPLLTQFDIVSDAGGSNTADIKVFRDITPAADGFLHLRFTGLRSRAVLSGLEIVPGLPGKMLPVRIVTREQPYFDKQGRLWGADRFFSGGRTVARTNFVSGTSDPELYRSERYGNFTYTIPVVDGGRYRVTLRFAETWFGPTQPGGGGAGSRVFDVFCNGVALLKNVDLYRESGGGSRALEMTFRGRVPNAQGKLVLSFVPIRNYACINAIEVVEEAD